MKNTSFFILILVAALAVTGIVLADVAVISTGQLLPDVSYRDPVTMKLFSAMNENRQLHNVPALVWDSGLESDAYFQNVKYVNREIIPVSLPWDKEDFLISETWKFQRVSDTMKQLDDLANTDRNFQLDQLNRDYHRVGISSINTYGITYVVFRFG
jgi:hypothetical protein